MASLVKAYEEVKAVVQDAKDIANNPLVKRGAELLGGEERGKLIKIQDEKGTHPEVPLPAPPVDIKMSDPANSKGKKRGLEQSEKLSSRNMPRRPVRVVRRRGYRRTRRYPRQLNFNRFSRHYRRRRRFTYRRR